MKTAAKVLSIAVGLFASVSMATETIDIRADANKPIDMDIDKFYD